MCLPSHNQNSAHWNTNVFLVLAVCYLLFVVFVSFLLSLPYTHKWHVESRWIFISMSWNVLKWPHFATLCLRWPSLVENKSIDLTTTEATATATGTATTTTTTVTQFTANWVIEAMKCNEHKWRQLLLSPKNTINGISQIRDSCTSDLR